MKFKYISLNVLIVISVVISGSDGRMTEKISEDWNEWTPVQTRAKNSERRFAHTKGELELTKKVVIDGQPCNDNHLSVSLFTDNSCHSG